MDVEYPGFGRIIVDGVEYDHDVVVEGGRVEKRDKGPSKSLKRTYGHTPLSERENVPWSHPRLIIGSGYSGSLPITAGVQEMARAKGVTLEIMPTSEACARLRDLESSECNAILHVTC
jgi:hypothetical protein